MVTPETRFRRGLPLGAGFLALTLVLAGVQMGIRAASPEGRLASAARALLAELEAGHPEARARLRLSLSEPRLALPAGMQGMLHGIEIDASGQEALVEFLVGEDALGVAAQHLEGEELTLTTAWVRVGEDWTLRY